MCASTGREGCGDVATASEKLDAQIQAVRCHAEGCDQHETATLSNCLGGMCVSPGIGTGGKKTFERAFISNLQMSDQKYQPFVERNSCAASITCISIVAYKR